MKYVIMLGDGMADFPIFELGGRTPLEAARTPNMDYIASQGTVGRVNTIMEGFTPASDVANMSILGYDVNECYPGRGPLEAASLGIELAPDDLAFRCNLVTLGNGPDPSLEDYAADQIPSAEAKEIIADLNRHLADEMFVFYPGVSFRHLLLWKGGNEKITTTPPHDIIGQKVAGFLPKGADADIINRLIGRSQEILKEHPVNRERVRKGKKPATSIWPWGQGRRPKMRRITDQYHLKGGMISAVDLLHGLGRYAGLRPLPVEGATGYTNTNYLGKGLKALEALRELDFVFVHVEAPDAMGHEGNLEGKIKAIEDFDEKVVGTVLKGISSQGSYRIMVASDHPTPLILRTHVSDPSPFAVLSSDPKENMAAGYGYNELSALRSGIYISPGYELFRIFIQEWRSFVCACKNKESI